jgi:hypothetical protein
MATTNEVAKWMLQKLEKREEIAQEDIVYEIERTFGGEFVYDNDNGNPAISKKVLSAFNKLTKDTVVWESGARIWRKRTPTDAPGRQQ